ncbi:phosphoglycerate mutase [[Clostridium] cellulosi]|uniref:Phosphoglycerate mutase n=1 Tax=[Clostridium] cellulosi TaxID=29343 RepID=A0A078KNL6_9FIRM|nr:phosphoglycerate mutase [[Clostridium] cellulosi]
MTKLYLVRHAEAQGNIDRYFHGVTDADISKNGACQLERLKERFKDIEIDAVYSSPLKRALKTAQAANFYHGLPIKTDEGLIEINGGHWECKRWEDIPKLYPEENEAWEKRPWLFEPVGGESMRHVYDRIWNTILNIIKENMGKRILVASHGCAIRNFACRASGLPIERLNEMDWFENTSISTFEFDDSLNVKVISLNDASHLDEETSTLPKQKWWQELKKKGV